MIIFCHLLDRWRNSWWFIQTVCRRWKILSNKLKYFKVSNWIILYDSVLVEKFLLIHHYSNFSGIEKWPVPILRRISHAIFFIKYFFSTLPTRMPHQNLLKYFKVMIRNKLFYLRMKLFQTLIIFNYLLCRYCYCLITIVFAGFTSRRICRKRTN